MDELQTKIITLEAAAIALFATVWIFAPAEAQQPAAGPATPMEQALGGKLQEEYNQNLQLRAANVVLQARVKELEAKYEPATPPTAGQGVNK